MRVDKQWPDVRVLTFPSGDRAFREHVVVAHERVGRWLEASVMHRIREAYPSATAIQAQGLAVLGGTPRWYVYRDGRARAQHGTGPWEDDPTTAIAIIGTDGRYVDANGATESLFGYRREEIVGRAAGDFTRHEDDETLGTRLMALAGSERLISTAVVRRRDGDEQAIEFSVRRVPSGYTVSMRPIGG
jgi:PAS domain S-box-containing protein